MGKYDLGINLAKEVSAYMRISGRSLLPTRPIGKINIEELRYATKLEGDVVQISKNLLKRPSAEKLAIMLEVQGLEAKYITDNNSLFLEELIKRFPLKQGQTNNKTIQDIMTCLEDINHNSFVNKKQFLDEFLYLEEFSTPEPNYLAKELCYKQNITTLNDIMIL